MRARADLMLKQLDDAAMEIDKALSHRAQIRARPDDSKSGPSKPR